MFHSQCGGAVAALPPQDLIVDQTIEKVSFCAPDRNFDKAFSYICRDGTTRRWICHGFLALKDSVSAGFPSCHKGGTLCSFSLPSAPEGGRSWGEAAPHLLGGHGAPRAPPGSGKVWWMAGLFRKADLSVNKGNQGRLSRAGSPFLSLSASSVVFPDPGREWRTPFARSFPNPPCSLALPLWARGSA